MKPDKIAERDAHNGFLAFLSSEYQHQYTNGHIGVADNYRSTGNSFARFLALRKKRDISCKKLSPLLMTDYEAWLQASGLCKNTTSFYIRTLQSVYYKAVRQGLTEDRKPFVGVYRGVAKTIKRAIASTDVCKLTYLDIATELATRGYTGKRLRNLQRQLEFARDIFVFCFCARGLTFADLAYMRKTSVMGSTMVYVRRKTKQRIEVQIEPMMQKVLDNHPSQSVYLLPILTKIGDEKAVYRQYRYALTRYNGHLKTLGMMLGGLKLTSYVSRHSWASAARQHHVPLSVISQSMGHDSEKTTEIYLKSLECNVINQTNRELLANVFNKDIVDIKTSISLM